MLDKIFTLVQIELKPEKSHSLVIGRKIQEYDFQNKLKSDTYSGR